MFLNYELNPHTVCLPKFASYGKILLLILEKKIIFHKSCAYLLDHAEFFMKNNVFYKIRHTVYTYTFLKIIKNLTILYTNEIVEKAFSLHEYFIKFKRIKQKLF